MTDMITATGLVKRYKEVEALAGLDLSVPEGTVLALLGPNGAGKTTAVRVLTTLLKPDAGSAVVAGVDILADPDGVRSRIGLSGQYAAVDEHLTGFENLEMVGRLYGMGRTQARARARELLERFDLADAGDRPSKTYSGGMRRRLDLAGALVAAPPVLVLDEPTTGLDPRSRVQMWDVIRELVASGATLLLTTQYLEEADRLADDILVIDHGRAIARGTADELKSQTGGERVEGVLADPALAKVVRTSFGLPDSFALLDIDHFKSCNDTFGHDAGDQVLSQFARVVERCVRPTDIVGRWGGEEFLVILPATGLKDALDIIERVRSEAALEEFDFAPGYRLRFSAGIAMPSETGGVTDACIKLADRRLYAAKHNGRNRTCIDAGIAWAGPPAPPSSGDSGSARAA